MALILLTLKFFNEHVNSNRPKASVLCLVGISSSFQFMWSFTTSTYRQSPSSVRCHEDEFATRALGPSVGFFANNARNLQLRLETTKRSFPSSRTTRQMSVEKKNFWTESKGTADTQIIGCSDV